MSSFGSPYKCSNILVAYGLPVYSIMNGNIRVMFNKLYTLYNNYCILQFI